jgi:UDP-2-acetamido-2-deoxy-ribo-hexuluronate aminotransferase
MMPFIDLKAQYRELKPDIDAAIAGVLEHGQYILGPEVTAMEQALASWVGTRHCISAGSGTDALLMSLMALGIQAGDEVITTPFTFAATAEVILLTGATPVFVDIEPDTCNIDTRLIEAKVSSRTRAIMPVSLYGQPANMDEINVLAEKHHLPVVEDAAQSFGAEYQGKKSCALSTIGCTSFFPSKPLGCYGDGGAIFTDDDAVAQACREIRVHGQSARYVHTRLGIGGRMDTLQCAVILAKLKRFDWEIERRLAIGARYNDLLDAAGIARVQQRADRTSVFAQYTAFVDDRAAVQESLKQAGIPTAVHYPIPLNRQPAYSNRSGGGATPAAASAAEHVMSLPMHPDLTDEQQDAIVDALVQAVGCGEPRSAVSVL